MKTIIVTGANSGLGLWTTKYLLDLDYKVIMACRNVEKAKTAIDEFTKFNKSKNYVINQLDLADFESIKNFVDELPENEQIYGLDCNAGIINEKEIKYTKNNTEETFGVNHLGHFYLTNLLLEKFDIQKIVIISSELHNPLNKSPFAKAVYKTVREMAYPIVESNRSIKKQNQEFYSNSKLCNVYFSYEFARKLIGKSQVNAYNPGLMPNTNFGKTGSIMNLIFSKILYIIGTVFRIATSPEKSAKYVARLFNEETQTGKYFEKDKAVKSSIDSYDENKAALIWKDSNELINEISTKI